LEKYSGSISTLAACREGISSSKNKLYIKEILFVQLNLQLLEVNSSLL